MTDNFSRRALAGLAATTGFGAVIGTATAQPANKSVLERIQRTKVLRVPGIAGAIPYWQKDPVTGEWSGVAVNILRDLAKTFDARVQIVETTYGNSILDIQADRIDVGFGLTPTPQRALVIQFSEPYLITPYGCLAKKGFTPRVWADLNNANIRVAFDLGSLMETCARRYAPNAQLLGFKTLSDATTALLSGRCDVQILPTTIGITAFAKNPDVGPFHLLTDPLIALPGNMAMLPEPSIRFMEVVNAWIDYNRGSGQIRDWMLAGTRPWA